MKKLVLGISLAGAVLAACLVPVTIVSTGCVTTVTTNDQQVINATAVILRGAARDGAVVAMQDDPNTKQYFALAATALSAFVTGKDYSPGAFQAALLNIKSPALTNQWVQIGLGTVIDLYQLYYGQYVQNTVNSSAVAQAFITAIQDGLNEALGNPVSATRRYYNAARPSVPPAVTGVLPRPIKK